MFYDSTGLASSQLNLNSWKILLSLFVASVELAIELGMAELKNMYNKKKNRGDGDRVYVLAYLAVA